MNFYEKPTEEGYTYTVDDVFGTIEIQTPDKLYPDKLDDVFMAIFETHKHDRGTVESSVKDTNIIYTFKKKNPWQKISEQK